MQTAQTEKPSTWAETLAGVFIFIQFPLIYYFGRYLFPPALETGHPNLLIALTRAILFFSLWFIIPLLGLIMGWLKGFPRWCYPYVAFAIIASFYLSNASTPGISLFGVQIFGRELWGGRACVPGLLMAALAFLLTRSFRSLLVFFENGWKDWTRFTYTLFGLMPLVNFIAFDEVRDSYELPYQVALLIIMVLAAGAYLRSTSPGRRALSLVAGFVLCVLIDAVGPTLYWLENDGMDPGGIGSMVTFAIYFLVVVFLPALIGFARHLTSSPLEGNS